MRRVDSKGLGSLGLIVAVAMGAGTPVAQAAEGDLSGAYLMNGVSLKPNSPTYAGECNLTLKGEVYDVDCVNTGSGDKYKGKGLRRGEQFSLYLGEYLLVYRIGADGTLDGNWAHADSDDYGKETLKPKK